MKKFYASKVLWVNFLSFIAIAIQIQTGTEICPPQYQAIALTMINAILRMITSTAVAPIIEKK